MEGGLSGLTAALEAAALQPYLQLYQKHVSKSNRQHR